jgi:hypothetical protein
MLESTPVYAINLLATDDTLDKIQYKSLSAATDKNNGAILEDSYRKFFSTTGFWKRDTDSFINLTKNDASYNDTILNITNISDKSVSVFVFKTKLSGFDRSLTEWYGTADKVPSYLNPNDYSSDYMVDCVVVAGDWSNYPVLAADPRWSKYFNTSGLKKTMIDEFANDRNVNLLAYYEGMSLIPYFRDGNGKNIFIESIINRDTDKTGLFCAFNIDKFETDYPKGMVDLIGNNLVGVENTTIDFLSYNDTISEVVPHGNVQLDSVGNVWAIAGPSASLLRGVTTGRTANYSEGYISGVQSSATSSTSTISYNLVLNSPYAVIGGKLVTIDTSVTSFSAPTASFVALGATYTSTIVLRTTGSIEKVDGTTTGVNPLVGVNDLVLGYSSVYLDNAGVFNNFTYNNVYTNATGYNELALTTDYVIATASNGITVTFENTAATPSLRSYEQYRRIKYFNEITGLLSSATKNYMTMLLDASTKEKLSLSGVTIGNIVTTTTSNKAFTLTGLPIRFDVVSGMLVFYTLDNETIVGVDSIITKSSLATTSQGVAAKYSSLYLNYQDGVINDGDYFYTNFITPGDKFNVSFVAATASGGSSYVVFNTTSGAASNGWPKSPIMAAGSLMFPGSTLNKGVITINDTTNYCTTFGGTAANGMYAFAVVESLSTELTPNVTMVYNLNLKHYLKIYIDSSNNIQINFTDSVGDPYPLDQASLQTINELVNTSYGFDVFSLKLNYKQSLDVTYPVGYSPVPNKILVSAARYTEVRVGDFLEAYVDTASLRVGEVPRKLTRILSKKFYPSDTTLVEISCDSRIKVTNLGTTLVPDWQSTRYTAIEDYITNYKAISLNGFKMRLASIPDGTEAKQTSILNLIANGTPLFNALVNKEAIDIRYLVDAFGLGLTEFSKQQLVDICGKRLDCFGFINMPSMKQFQASVEPSFVNADGVLDTSYIAQGGNPESNPLFTYSFGTGAGTTCVGYFLPYLQVDDGRPLDLPPAMFAATTYLRKHNSNITSIVPWTIAAGVTNGKVTGFQNVEMDFTSLDIENLNGAQMNPIVYKRNRGFVIETENTAQTLYKSALSYIHVREVLVELERELSRMLLDFQWKFNTPDVRAEIKLRADVICEQYVSKNGLYNYFNKCDDENNTNDIIDNQIGVLDTYVEPIKGMGIIVNNVTILRTGAIKSGGFITA